MAIGTAVALEKRLLEGAAAAAAEWRCVVGQGWPRGPRLPRSSPDPTQHPREASTRATTIHRDSERVLSPEIPQYSIRWSSAAALFRPVRMLFCARCWRSTHKRRSAFMSVAAERPAVLQHEARVRPRHLGPVRVRLQRSRNIDKEDY